jgi:hypothetical protein
MLDRRSFLLAGAAAAVASADSAPAATVLYGDRATPLSKIGPVPQNNDLWVRKVDLPAINDFHIKPQGACREDLCIPIAKELQHKEYFNLSGFARKTGETVIRDEAGVYSFGEIPLVRGAFYNSRMAPDFAVPDRKGRVVHLNDFRGKKVLVFTWASW